MYKENEISPKEIGELIEILKSISSHETFTPSMLKQEWHYQDAFKRYMFLTDNGFAEDVIIGDAPYFIKFTDKGRNLIRYGSLDKFRTKEKRRYRAEDRENWRKTYWLPIAIASLLIGFGLGLLINAVKQSNQSGSKQPKSQEIQAKISPIKPAVK